MSPVQVDAASQAAPVFRRRAKPLDVALFVKGCGLYFVLEASVFPPLSALRQAVAFALLLGGGWCLLRGVRQAGWYALGGFLGACALRLMPLLPSAFAALKALSP